MLTGSRWLADMPSERRKHTPPVHCDKEHIKQDILTEDSKEMETGKKYPQSSLKDERISGMTYPAKWRLVTCSHCR